MEHIGMSSDPKLTGAANPATTGISYSALAPHAGTVTDLGPQGLDKAFFQIRRMVQMFGQPHPITPTKMTLSQAAHRSKWIKEECDELTESTTLEDQADAFLDVIVFAIGGLVEMGIMPQPLLDIVQRANMAKGVMVNGTLTVVKNDEGKVQKPAGWKENFEPQPLIAAEIARQTAASLIFAPAV